MKQVVLLVLIIGLGACSTTPEPQINTEILNLPKEVLQQCEQLPLPDFTKEDWLALSYEQILTLYADCYKRNANNIKAIKALGNIQ